MATDVEYATNIATQEVSPRRGGHAAAARRRRHVARGGVRAGLRAPRGSAPHARGVRKAESQPPPLPS